MAEDVNQTNTVNVKSEEDKIVKVNGKLINSGIIAFGTTASKVLGFVREMVIAAFFGASYLVDAYLVAMVIPQVLFSIISASLTTTVIPLVTEYENLEGRQSVLRLLNTVTTIMAVFLAVLIILGELLSPFLIRLVAPGFSGVTADLAVYLNRIMFPMMLFLGLAGLGTGILQSQRRFLYPAFIGVPYNFFIIGSLFVLGKTWGVTGLALGTLLGVVSQWLFQIPEIRKCRFPFNWNLDFSHPGLKKIGRLILPVIIGSGAGQINFVVDRMMASGLVEGSIAALNYATKLNLMVYSIIAMAVANAIYPEFAEAAVVKDGKKFLNSMLRSMNGLMLVVIPISVGMMILKEPMIRLVYERGAFDAAAAQLTVTALFFFSFGLPAMSLREIVFRAFYSVQDTMTPMIIGVVTVALNIGMILLLVPYLAIGGLALATSISVSAGLVLLLYYLRKKLGHIGGRVLLATGAKILLASLIMGLVVYGSYHYMNAVLSPGRRTDLLLFGVNTFLGGGVYFALVYLFKVEELGWLADKVRGRLGR
ncbi:MAG: murein biosynthesis integral membrane protein MurJ [Bacillota bacterium]